MRVDRRRGGDPRDADASRVEQLNAAIEYAFCVVRDVDLEEVLPEILAKDLELVALPQALRRQQQTMGRVDLRGSGGRAATIYV
jgi:hypothetical protein